MASLIDAELEFCEVLNAFPYIKTKLEKSDFDLRDVVEGVTIQQYFENKSYSDDDIDLLVKKLNFDLRRYLKNQEINEFKLQPEKDVLFSENAIKAEAEEEEE